MIQSLFAERGGFEPPVRRKANNGFRDRRIRPLCHLSLLFSRIRSRRLPRSCGAISPYYLAAFDHGVYRALAGPSLLKYRIPKIIKYLLLEKNPGQRS